MEEAFIGMPHVLAMDLHLELTADELNGNPINRITGNLANSFDIMQMGKGKWALLQVNTQAPYAQRVMVNVAIKRTGRPALTKLRDRRYPIYNKAIIAEFISMVRKANTSSYKWNPQTFEARLH